MLHRAVTMSVDTLTRVMCASGVGEPHRVLAGEAMWMDPESDRAADNAAWAEFSGLGLAGPRGMDADTLDSLLVLAQPTVEYYGWIDKRGKLFGLLAGAIGDDALIAVRLNQRVRIVGIEPDQLADILIAQLPPVGPAHGRSITVPQSRYQAVGSPTTCPDGSGSPIDSGDRDVAALRRLAGAPQTGSGELYVAVRDQITRRRTAVRYPVAYVDTNEGRWQMTLSIRDGSEPWITATPATTNTLLECLRKARQSLPT